ncbi:glycosyltransferase family 2 protein [Halomicroarcula sp. F13]|uniref:Glycosyltransferase family 2 protein n=1 Tax=Haloarcula rubra TaxID=2487747 RepID=A0AAW4PLY1_9EURY|nr:glycosyltransferase family 2 protein [Halomicroarcula rubra]MBX0322129.1 glycosyltransferase family 2 protein [Halomicroarcula rubra]
MKHDSAHTQIDDVSVTKTVVDVDGGRRFVSLAVETQGSESVAVSISDSLPATETLTGRDRRAGDGTFSGGRLAIEGVVEPGESATVGYLVEGPGESAVSDPTVDGVVPLSGDDELPATPTVRWVSADGDTTVLDVTTASVPGRTEGPIPLVSIPDDTTADATDAARDVAIGLVLTPTNGDAAIRTVLRASRRGHPVLVTSSGLDENDEPLDTLASLGATVLSPPSRRASQAELNRLLSRTARERGLPGIVLQTRDCPRIDYDRTSAAFQHADYEVVAIPEQWSGARDTPTVVVGIPAYNAADSIADVVDRAAPYADEVVVVDDGSRDDTAGRAREAGATVVVHDRNQGYGGALKTLFREAADRDAAHLVVVDADGQHDPGDIPTLVETQTRDDADIVIGSRYVGERRSKIPFVRSLGLAVINDLTNVSLGNLRPSGWVRDTQSGYRAYGRRAVRSLASDQTIGNNMGASTDILYHAHRNRLSVAEVGTTISYDVANASTQGSLSHGLDLVRNIVWTVEYGRPLLIVGLPGAITTLLGVCVTLLLLAQYVDAGTFHPIQLGIAIMFAIGGTLLCITALMMHVLNGHPTMKRLGQ